MLCDECHKNEATIHIQEIVDGTKKTLNLCSECAARKSKNDPDFDLGGFNLAEMLYNITEKLNLPGFSMPEGDPKEPEVENSPSQMVCPECAWSLERLRKTGRLGCPRCYEAFRDIIREAIENMHRGKMHVGKRPGAGVGDESPLIMLKIMNLQKELDEVVQREEYEKAAEIRDRISGLKNKLKTEKSEKKS